VTRMPDFEKPTFPFAVQVQDEIQALRGHKSVRAIPDRSTAELLIATWNIANFGTQQRENEHLDLIAEVLGWFDLVAVQEVKDNFADLDNVVARVGGSYHYLISDVAGNSERMAFVYDSSKLGLLEKVGEVAVPPKDHRHIKVSGTQQKFSGFDRNPFIATFRVGQTSFAFVNVHLYFGSNSSLSRNRRALETYAVARWADLRRKSRFAFTREIIALGDFNMPKREPGDPIYDALTRRGLQLPQHSTQIASSIATDAQYDQIAFFPGKTKELFTGQHGVFDFDQVTFAELWNDPTRTEADFKAYVRYYLSDHRPMWMQFAGL
jgi:endonuclease/exonuclease/phosphatase family metal-dependent hydrolase